MGDHSDPNDHADPHTIADLEAAIGTLRSLNRQLFLAHCIDHMTYVEMARRTGLSVRHVERRMARAIRQFDAARRGIRPPWWRRLRRLRWWPF
ncbi:sigma factor-like helix-turn-helix DNA-binding protein [Sphingomonas bacterium]|uniref:sigma-70 region 4 domain-containing protein n=1 Tax=Sphingomonas bacterium TaxID=1895847 RepID=UPI0015767F90|nr:sigma-70 region 4 domain-containing protein [Sphingomonas bacterium]